MNDKRWILTVNSNPRNLEVLGQVLGDAGYDTCSSLIF